MSTTTNDITAAQWLDVRDAVARKVKTATPGTQASTTVNIAERLLRDGYVDIDAVLAEITPKPVAKIAVEPARLEPGTIVAGQKRQL